MALAILQPIETQLPKKEIQILIMVEIHTLNVLLVVHHTMTAIVRNADIRILIRDGWGRIISSE